MRSLGKSDFAGLVRYITDAQSKDHRLGQVQVTNCDADTVRDAITEVLATQQANTRAKRRQDLSPDRQLPRPASSRAPTPCGRSRPGSAPGWALASISASAPCITTPTTCTSTSPSTRFTRRGARCTSRTTRIGRWPSSARPLERDYGLERDNHEPRTSAARRPGPADMERTPAWKAWSAGSSASAWRRSRARRAGPSCTRSCATTAWSCAHEVTAWSSRPATARSSRPAPWPATCPSPRWRKRLGTFEASPERQERAPARRSYQKGPVRLRGGLTRPSFTPGTRAHKRTSRPPGPSVLAEGEAPEGSSHRERQEGGGRQAGGDQAADRWPADQEAAVCPGQRRAAGRPGGDPQAPRPGAGGDLQEYRGGRGPTGSSSRPRGDGQALDALRAREAAQGLKGDTIQGDGRPPSPAMLR
jgi:hypothetical protein